WNSIPRVYGGTNGMYFGGRCIIRKTRKISIFIRNIGYLGKIGKFLWIASIPHDRINPSKIGSPTMEDSALGSPFPRRERQGVLQFEGCSHGEWPLDSVVVAAPVYYRPGPHCAPGADRARATHHQRDVA